MFPGHWYSAEPSAQLEDVKRNNYVYRASDGLFVNAQLVREGAARADPFPDNHAHATLFSTLAARARAAGRGLWGACPA